MLIFAMVSAFVSQPQACDKGWRDYVCFKEGVLYGTKQAAAAWQKF
jgi:hypothetical protein